LSGPERSYPSTVEREILEVDVLVVGAGPAGLAFATQLARECREGGLEKAILVVDKASEIGGHQLSGAVLDPRSILELHPGALEEGFPLAKKVTGDSFWWLNKKGRRKFSGFFCPPPFRNRGKWMVSASDMVKWMASKAEEEGVEIHPGVSGAEVLVNEGRVLGVRTVDQGRSRLGEEKGTFQPGFDIRAEVTVLAEGTRGSLTKSLLSELDLDKDSNPQIWSVGVKELWEVEHSMEGEVVHTAGWPLTGNEFGGGWIYGLPDNRLSVGFVVGMDHGNAGFDYHAALQEWKTHPSISFLLEGGKLLKYGAKTIPEGGWFSLPEVAGNGFLILGDAAGFMNVQRLKGLHLAVKSGLVAARAAAKALAENSGQGNSALTSFLPDFRQTWAGQELWKVRNFRQAFQKGFRAGVFRSGLDHLLGGRLPGRLPMEADHARYKAGASPAKHISFDGKLTFDRLTDLYHSGTSHEEDQPCHLVVLDPEICTTRCTEEFGNPCQHFCPAEVYDWRGDEGLHINASNCVHCKTCDIADPYQIINWVVPEEGGPAYMGM